MPELADMVLFICLLTFHPAVRDSGIVLAAVWMVQFNMGR